MDACHCNDHLWYPPFSPSAKHANLCTQLFAGGYPLGVCSGCSIYLTGLAFIFNRFVSIAGYILAALVISFVLMIHLPEYLNAGHPEMRQLAFVNLLKDLALAGFALYIAANTKNQHLNRN